MSNPACEDTFWRNAKHNFGEWKVVGDLVKPDPYRGIIGFAQQRVCKDCGFTQVNQQLYI